MREVQEVVRPQPLTRLPLGPAAVRGLINLRVQIVAAVDLRRRLGLPDRAAAAGPPMTVVLRSDDTPTSLLVDAVGDVTAGDGRAFEPPPDTLPAAARGLVRGAFKLPGRLLLVLDVERVLTLTP